MNTAATPTLPVSPRYFALVPCAGVGARSGQALPKQYATVAGRAVVAHTLLALADVARLSVALVVLHPDDQWFGNAAIAESVPRRPWLSYTGGASRAETVAAGLKALLEHGARVDDWVLVHDAARCLVRSEWINRLIDACAADPIGGLLALPLADTLKEEQSSRAVRTLDRRAKWQAQTPQMFRIGVLQQALHAAGDAVTDEASAIEALGHAPLLVPGALENFKLTWPEDFALAERLLATREFGFHAGQSGNNPAL